MLPDFVLVAYKDLVRHPQCSASDGLDGSATSPASVNSLERCGNTSHVNTQNSVFTILYQCTSASASNGFHKLYTAWPSRGADKSRPMDRRAGIIPSREAIILSTRDMLCVRSGLSMEEL